MKIRIRRPKVESQLLHGDCLELMKKIPDEKIDAIITDPPYGMGFRSNHRTDKYDAIQNDNNLEWVDLWVDECYRVLKSDRCLYSFCSFHHIDIFKQALQKVFNVKNILIWEKNNTSMGDLKGDYAPKHEMIFFCHKGRRELLAGYRSPNVLHYKRTGNKLHPTEKPVELIDLFIRNSTLPGELILDPFSGSGTTAIAAINTNRKYICIEKDDNYYRISKERIANYKYKKEVLK